MHEGVPLRDIIFQNVFRILALNYQLFATTLRSGFKAKIFCFMAGALDLNYHEKVGRS